MAMMSLASQVAAASRTQIQQVASVGKRVVHSSSSSSSSRPKTSFLCTSSSLLAVSVSTHLKHRSFSTKAAAVDTATTKTPIAVGDKLPEAELSYFDDNGTIQSIKVSELTKQKKVVLLAVPGAFTPTCSQKHLPGFVEKADELKAKGVDTIACVSINDAFVMKSWGDSLGVAGKILMLSDGNGKFSKELGVTVDLSDKVEGLGVRSRRYSLLAEDGVVKVLNLEEGGAYTVSGADEILKVL